jgi:hypothetical protein
MVTPVERISQTVPPILPGKAKKSLADLYSAGRSFASLLAGTVEDQKRAAEESAARKADDEARLAAVRNNDAASVAASHFQIASMVHDFNKKDVRDPSLPSLAETPSTDEKRLESIRIKAVAEEYAKHNGRDS